MPSIKTVFILLIVSIVSITIAFQCVVFPILKKNHSLVEKEKLLVLLQEKSDQMTDITQRNVKYSQVLRNAIQANISLAYLQEQVNASGLVVESMKITHVKECDDIHILLKGNYHHLLRFLTLLAERPNGMRLRALALKKNQIIMSIHADKAEKNTIKPARHHAVLDTMQRIKKDLVSVQLPALFMPHHDLPHDVQSPFVSRKVSMVMSNAIQFLARYRWYYVGDVHQAGRLLGVFLEAQGKSHYFGLGLSWQDSEWTVVDIGARAVFFKHNLSQERWRLIYAQKRTMNECLPKACIK